MVIVRTTLIAAVAFLSFILGYEKGVKDNIKQSYAIMARSFEIGCNFFKSNIDQQDVLCYNYSMDFLNILEESDNDSN